VLCILLPLFALFATLNILKNEAFAVESLSNNCYVRSEIRLATNIYCSCIKHAFHFWTDFDALGNTRAVSVPPNIKTSQKIIKGSVHTNNNNGVLPDHLIS
jgi:hypothetical protein